MKKLLMLPFLFLCLSALGQEKKPNYVAENYTKQEVRIKMRDGLELFTAIENKDSSSLDAIVKKHVYGGINRLGEKLTTEFTGYFLPH